jgi:hypothetical protein
MCQVLHARATADVSRPTAPPPRWRELRNHAQHRTHHTPTHAGGALDLKALSVIPGKACWVVFVDALLLNDGGNVLDALACAARAALALTRVPTVRGRVRGLPGGRTGGARVMLRAGGCVAAAVSFAAGAHDCLPSVTPPPPHTHTTRAG